MPPARPSSSFDRVLVVEPMTEAEMRVLIKRAWREKGVAVFLADDLDRMPGMLRAVVESEMARVYGVRSSV